MKRERLWHPPGSFAGVTHWCVKTLRVSGDWVTYTEHATQAAAAAQAARILDRWPTSRVCVVRVAVAPVTLPGESLAAAAAASGATPTGAQLPTLRSR